MRAIVRILVAAASAYVALAAILFLSQRALLYPGAGDSDMSSRIWGDAVDLATPDGERLLALHSAALPGRPTVLFFHGNADRVDRYGFLARALSDRGIGLLAVSYRGFPGSTGRPSEAGLVVDGLAAHDWLASRSDDPIVLLGQSLGSGVAVAVAATRQPAGLILVSAFDSVLAVARATYFFLPVGALLKDPFRSDLRIASVRAPVLFIHGALDTLVAPSHGARLFELAAAPKRMVTIDDAGHNDIWRDGVVAEIVDFADRPR